MKYFIAAIIIIAFICNNIYFAKKIEEMKIRIEVQNDAILNFMFNGDIDDAINYLLMKDHSDGRADVMTCISQYRM